MKPSPAVLLHPLCLGLLRCASQLVPGKERDEWWREWRAELWHVRRSCTPRNGVSWSGELQVAAFCFGAFQDALSLRQQAAPRRVPLATTMGSPNQCLAFLACLVAIGYGIASFLPGVSATMHPPQYRDAHHLMLIQDSRYVEREVPAVSANQFLAWQSRKQDLFDSLAFYQLKRESVSGLPHTQVALGVAHASSNLLDLLGLPVRFAQENRAADPGVAKLVLSDAMWRRDFRSDPNIQGRTVRVGSRRAVIAGVAVQGMWNLPGKVDAWLLEPDSASYSADAGFVVAHLKPSCEHAGWDESWHMSAPKLGSDVDDWLCVSLAKRTRGSWDIFLFTVFLACLALPATTSLPLGEYPRSSRTLSWGTRLRRWSFLGGKIALLLPIVYFVSLDLAHMHVGITPVRSQYIQIVASFSITLFGLRWTLRDQRQRCPMCLGKLTHPARVGEPSRNFLTWNGTELICAGGHGLLHIPELPTSWFSTQRWLYLDPSWEGLFVEAALSGT